ncbi:hypothetical protein R3P38DRAFT_3266562 [Favolaschia claudopus]|uniref:Uncharacterized protein n=1 Tax=Favolaschia claudopus TaxID=2862362 RepID=A0AAW0BST0_9AGAR
MTQQPVLGAALHSFAHDFSTISFGFLVACDHVQVPLDLLPRCGLTRGEPGSRPALKISTAPRRPADPFNVEGPKYATSKAKPFPNVIRNAEVNPPHFDAKLAATSAICYHPVSKHPDSIVHPPRRPTTANPSSTSSTVPTTSVTCHTLPRITSLARHEACPVHLYSWFAKPVTCDEPAPTSISLSTHPSPTPEPRRTGPACPKFEASG